jgi:uncharacterized protein (TIGR04552 family)
MVDLNLGALKPLDEFSLSDVECVRLVLRGDSVIDWHRLHLAKEEQARALLSAEEFDPDDPHDRERLESIQAEAIAYLRRQFDFPVPRPVERASVEELLLLASTKGHRQLCACTVLKAMHIIQHLDGRELLFSLPASDQDLFHLVEEKVYRVVGGMLAAGYPITEFVGGRKNKDSLYTKLLSKTEATAAAIYDKLRFRIVTRDVDDVLPVLLKLTEKLFPFNYVVPGQSINTVLHLRRYLESRGPLRALLRDLQIPPSEGFIENDNTFSAQSYRVMHFVVDVPIRLPDKMLESVPPSAKRLGRVVFVLCEFQLLDRKSESQNETGEASHASYKERQKAAVKRRLKIGVRALREPPRSSPARPEGAMREPPARLEAVEPEPPARPEPADAPRPRPGKRPRG